MKSIDKTSFEWDFRVADALEPVPIQPQETADKFVTTPEQHEQRKNWWYKAKTVIPLPKRSAIEPEWLEQYYKKNGPYLYHVTTPEAAKAIVRDGLFPWNHEENRTGTNYEDDNLRPREGHVYLANEKAFKRVYDYVQQKLNDLNIDYDWSDPTKDEPVTLRVDLRHLDPRHITADEDSYAFHHPGDYDVFPHPQLWQNGGMKPFWHDDPDMEHEYHAWRTWYRDNHNEGWDSWPPGHSVREWTSQWKAQHPGFKQWDQLGDWANERGLNDPDHVRHSLKSIGSIAYNGVVPPAAIEQGQYSNAYNSITGPHYEWTPQVSEPNEQPNVVPNSMTASLFDFSSSKIGKLTESAIFSADTIGKLSALPQHKLEWTPGNAGKGFVLNDGSVWTWPVDDSSRPFHFHKDFQVKGQGKKQMPGSAFHIRPDGGVFSFGVGRTLDNNARQMIQNADPNLSLDALPPVDFEPSPFGHAETLMNALPVQSAFRSLLPEDEKKVRWQPGKSQLANGEVWEWPYTWDINAPAKLPNKPRTLIGAEWPVDFPTDEKYNEWNWGGANDPRWHGGGCMQLALAINRKTGWPIHTIDYGAHYVNKTPDGQMLDHRGFQPFPKEWSGSEPEAISDVQRAAKEWGLGNWGDDADIVADQLLQRQANVQQDVIESEGKIELDHKHHEMHIELNHPGKEFKEEIRDKADDEYPGWQIHIKDNDSGQQLWKLEKVAMDERYHECPNCGHYTGGNIVWRFSCPNCGEPAAKADYTPQDNPNAIAMLEQLRQLKDNPIMSPEHPDPWMDSEPGTLTYPQHWNFSKLASPASPEFWDDYSYQYPELYHGTSIDRLNSIMRHGLLPWDHPDNSGGSVYSPFGYSVPRPNHVYLTDNVGRAQQSIYDADTNYNDPILLKINPRELDPTNINPDEDHMPGGWPPKVQGGEWAEQQGWGNNPQETDNSIRQHSTMAHRGPIPPEAITPYYRDINNEWARLPERYWGASSTDDLEPLYSSTWNKTAKELKKDDPEYWETEFVRTPYCDMTIYKGPKKARQAAHRFQAVPKGLTRLENRDNPEENHGPNTNVDAQITAGRDIYYQGNEITDNKRHEQFSHGASHGSSIVHSWEWLSQYKPSDEETYNQDAKPNGIENNRLMNWRPIISDSQQDAESGRSRGTQSGNHKSHKSSIAYWEFDKQAAQDANKENKENKENNARHNVDHRTAEQTINGSNFLSDNSNDSTSPRNFLSDHPRQSTSHVQRTSHSYKMPAPTDNRTTSVNNSDFANELLAHVKTTHTYATYPEDSRELSDPATFAIPKHNQPPGCSCNLGHKLDCPIHGLDGQINLDDSWHIPQTTPVGIAGQNSQETHSSNVSKSHGQQTKAKTNGVSNKGGPTHTYSNEQDEDKSERYYQQQSRVHTDTIAECPSSLIDSFGIQHKRAFRNPRQNLRQGEHKVVTNYGSPFGSIAAKMDVDDTKNSDRDGQVRTGLQPMSHLAQQSQGPDVGSHNKSSSWNGMGYHGGDLFHVAPTSERERILQHGLQVSNPASPISGWPFENLNPPLDPPSGVYGFQDPDHARDYADWKENYADYADNDDDDYADDDDDYRKNPSIGVPHDIWRIPAQEIVPELGVRIDPDMGSMYSPPPVAVKHPIMNPELYERAEERYQPPRERDYMTPEESWNLKEYKKPWGIGLPDRVLGSHLGWNFESALHDHYNPWTGKECNCGWGRIYGRTASQNVRMLRNQNQKIFRTPEGQEFLSHLEYLAAKNPAIEGMVPWLASRYKHGDVGLKEVTPISLDGRLPSSEKILGWSGEAEPQGFHNELEYSAPRWGDWFNARQHPLRRGVNIMEKTPREVDELARQHRVDVQAKQEKQNWLAGYGGSEPMHVFGPEAGPYAGWQVHPVDSLEKAWGESEALGHCMGNGEHPYAGAIDNGDIQAYSLRDREGYPHVSWHINPSGDSIGHMQGKSGYPKQEYRDLISQFNEHHGLPDYEGGEEELPGQNLAEWQAPDPTTLEEYMEQNGPNADLWDMAAQSEENVGEDTYLRPGTPDWKGIIHDIHGRVPFWDHTQISYKPGTVRGANPDELGEFYDYAVEDGLLPVVNNLMREYQVDPNHPQEQEVQNNWNKLTDPHYHPMTGEFMNEPVMHEYQQPLYQQKYNPEAPSWYQEAMNPWPNYVQGKRRALSKLWKLTQDPDLPSWNTGKKTYTEWTTKTADWFHWAPTTERARIQQHGLQPSKPGISPNWENVYEQIQSQPTGVYVVPDEETANHVRNIVLHHLGPMDMWRIPDDQIQSLRKDPLLPFSRSHIIPHAVEQPILHEPYFGEPPSPWHPSWQWRLGDDPDLDRTNWGEKAKEYGIGFPDRVIGSWQFPAL